MLNQQLGSLNIDLDKFQLDGENPECEFDLNANGLNNLQNDKEVDKEKDKK